LDHSISTKRLYLPARDYGFANIAFGFELSAAVADGIAKRTVLAPKWPELKYLVLNAHYCGSEGGQNLNQLYPQFGIDGSNDFQLEFHASRAPGGEGYDRYGWQTGSTSLLAIVAFRTLDLAAAEDPELARIVATADPFFTAESHEWFGQLGSSRQSLLRKGAVLSPDEISKTMTGQLCTFLAGRL